ncbi:MAG: BCD family MFS transporter [Anaerolineales bacterium]
MQSQKRLSVLRNMKIGLFHIGSSMADVLGSGIWNRVMIKDLGYAATPVGLLLALRYFLAPMAAWAGARSDQTNVRGYKRLPWVLGGRLAMIAGYMLVAFSTIELARHGSEWWIGIILGFVLASLGQNASGSTFLALVYDRAPADQRGRAVGIVWTFLLAGYAVSGVLFSRLFPEYTEGAFLTFFATVGVIMGGIWLFAVWGEEKPQAPDEADEQPTNHTNTPHHKPNFAADLRNTLDTPSARMLAFFMLLSFAAAFMQDSILEPFGGRVFDLSVGETTRFQAYWGTMAIVSSVGALWGYRRFARVGYKRLSGWGVWVMIATFSALALTSFAQWEALLRPSLLLLGIGYGLWNIGTVGLMVDHSREGAAGLDLGIWTVIATLCRGSGVLLGAVLYDVMDTILAAETAAYGSIFMIEVVLLLAAIPFLNQIGQTEKTGVTTTPRQEQELVMSSTLD